MREDFVLIPGGTFQMGSPESEAWRSADETPHTVTVSDFYMCRYEVTQADYQRVMGSNPSAFSGDDLPVESVSWLDAVAYCNALSEAEGLTPVYAIEGQTVSGTGQLTATACPPRRSGSTPAGLGQRPPSTPRPPSARRNPTTTDTTPTRSRTTTSHRGISPPSRGSTGRPR